MADDLTVSEAAKLQILAVTNDLGERVKSIAANAFEEAMSIRQRACGQMQQERDDARRERDELVRATATARGEGVKLDEENDAKRRRGAELDDAIAAKAAELRARHDELERITAAVVAASRAARPAVAV